MNLGTVGSFKNCDGNVLEEIVEGGREIILSVGGRRRQHEEEWKSER